MTTQTIQFRERCPRSRPAPGKPRNLQEVLDRECQTSAGVICRTRFAPFQYELVHDLNPLHPHPDVLHHRGYPLSEELRRGRLVGVGVHLHLLDLGQLQNVCEGVVQGRFDQKSRGV